MGHAHSWMTMRSFLIKHYLGKECISKENLITVLFSKQLSQHKFLKEKTHRHLSDKQNLTFQESNALYLITQMTFIIIYENIL